MTGVTSVSGKSFTEAFRERSSPIRAAYTSASAVAICSPRSRLLLHEAPARAVGLMRLLLGGHEFRLGGLHALLQPFAARAAGPAAPFAGLLPALELLLDVFLGEEVGDLRRTSGRGAT